MSHPVCLNQGVMKNARCNTLAPSERTPEEEQHNEIYRLTLRTLIYPAHDQIVAYALDTDLMGSGHDEETAVESLRQTVRAFLEEAAGKDRAHEFMSRKAHPSFYERWQEPPYGVEAGYLSITMRFRKQAAVAEPIIHELIPS